MKRIGVVASLAVMIVMLACPFTYAAGELQLESISPSDGQGGLQPANVAIKMTFNENMTSEAAQAANDKCFTITDENGETHSYLIAYNQKKYPNDIWVIMNEDLESNMEYTFSIDGSLQSSAGTTLGSTTTTTFRIRNTQTDGTINMVMMFGMMGGMFFLSSMEAKRQGKKQAEQSGEEEVLNPYKIAKEKNMSLQEAVAYVEKEKARLEKKRAKAAAQDDDEDEHNNIQDGVKRVAKVRPIAAVGGKTPRSVVLQKQKRREEKDRERRERLLREKARQEKKRKK